MEIKVCTLELVDEAALFAATRNAIAEFRCRPFLINTSLESIRREYVKYIEGSSKDVILQYEKGVLVGVTAIYWIQEDLYLSFTRGIFFEGKYSKVARNFVEYLCKKFSGYRLYINTASEHRKSIDYFGKNGFELLEDSVLYVLEDYGSFIDIGDGIEFLDDKNADVIFNHLESIMTSNTYWNVERVKMNLERFIVLGYFEREIEGALYAQIYMDSSVEVFGIAGDKSEVVEALMRALIFRCNRLKARRLLLYTDEEDEVNLAVSLGFKYFDSNKCFMKAL